MPSKHQTNAKKWQIIKIFPVDMHIETIILNSLLKDSYYCILLSVL